MRYSDPTGHYGFEETPDDSVFWNRDKPNGLEAVGIRGNHLSFYNWEESQVTGYDMAVPFVALYGGPVLIVAGEAVATEVGLMALGNAATRAAPFAPFAQQIQQKAKVTYDASLGALVRGTTDKFGNIRINPSLPRTERLHTLYHEQVHAFFTPRGPLQDMRQNISMWAYGNSSLLRYTEEAIAQTRANWLMGRNLSEGLMFPIMNGYVRPDALLFESLLLGGGTIKAGQTLANQWEEK